jgi:hypothetical protein
MLSSLKNLKMRKLLFLLLPLVFSLASCSKKKTLNVPKQFKLPMELAEVSGLYYQNFDKLWWLNDSGGQPKLYQTNAKGILSKTILLDNTINKDWEELSHDDQGNIYIGDFGNNRSDRKDLRIYIYQPEKMTLDSITFTYPDQELFPPLSSRCNFNMEAFFWHQGDLHLFSKNRFNVGDYFTKHYVLEAKAGTQVAVLKDRIFLKDRVVTAAAISPDGNTIVLLYYHYKKRKYSLPKSRTSVFFFRNFEGTTFFKGEMKKQKVPILIFATQYESLDFLDNKNILVASEKTKYFRQPAKRLKVKW